jgi:hypothetical protein
MTDCHWIAPILFPLFECVFPSLFVPHSCSLRFDDSFSFLYKKKKKKKGNFKNISDPASVVVIYLGTLLIYLIRKKIKLKKNPKDLLRSNSVTDVLHHPHIQHVQLCHHEMASARDQTDHR